MPVLSFSFPNIESEGATINIVIVPPLPVVKELHDKKETIPTKRVTGLIDTGASCSAIDSKIAEELQLIARDKKPVLTPSGISEQWFYDIIVFLGDTDIPIPIQVNGANLERQPYKALIGRDVLRACTLVFNGWDNSYDLHLHRDKIKI